MRDPSRRGFIRATSSVLLGAVSMPVLAACTPVATPSSPAASGAGSGGKAKPPTYVALPGLPSPDLPGTPDGLRAPGYVRYPAKLIRSVPRRPGKGGDVNALTVSLSSAPTPLDNNPAWQLVNKELGVSLKIPSISTADYPARLNTVVAGSDLPDLIAAAIFSTIMPNMADFLNSACADLTPYLSDDAIKDYPSLANLPSTAWQMVFNNKIMAVPISAGGVRTSPLLLARSGDLDKAGISKNR